MYDERNNTTEQPSWWRRFGPPLRWLVVGLPAAGGLLLAGVGAISLGRAQTEAAAHRMGLLGEGLMLAGGVLGVVVTLRVWWLMFKAAGWTARRGTDGSKGDV